MRRLKLSKWRRVFCYKSNAYTRLQRTNESKSLVLLGNRVDQDEICVCQIGVESVFRGRNNNRNILLVVVNEVNLKRSFDLVSDLLSCIVVDQL